MTASEVSHLGDLPSRTVIVVVRVQGPEETQEKHLILEAATKVVILKDLGTDCRGAPRDNEDAAINIRLRSNLEVVAGEVKAGNEVGKRFPQAATRVTNDFLVRPNKADLGIVKGGNE